MATANQVRHGPDRSRGFSLIELMVALVVVAVLGAIAIPSYQSYTRDARRAAATSALSDVAARQEQFCWVYPNLAKPSGSISEGSVSR